MKKGQEESPLKGMIMDDYNELPKVMERLLGICCADGGYREVPSCT